MKKFLSLILSLAIITVAVSLTACTKEDTSVQVGIILPTKDEPRWLQDEKSFIEVLDKTGFTSEVLFSESSSGVEFANVEALLAKNIKVLVICPQDSVASAAAVDKAKEAGVTVVSYDRLIMGTDAVDYYVTFENFSVGSEQGKYLVEAYKGKKGVPLYLYAGAVTDNNPFYNFSGAWSVLGKAVEEGQFVVKNCPAVTDHIGKQFDPYNDHDELAAILGSITTNWDVKTAESAAKSDLSDDNKKATGDVAILAPNDPTARAIADVFAADEAITGYVITGQDAEVESLRYIRDGKQDMTIWKDTSVLCPVTCEMVNAILKGETPKTDTTYHNQSKEVPTAECKVKVIDKNNLEDYIADGSFSKEAIDAAGSND